MFNATSGNDSFLRLRTAPAVCPARLNLPDPALRFAQPSSGCRQPDVCLGAKRREQRRADAGVFRLFSELARAGRGGDAGVHVVQPLRRF